MLRPILILGWTLFCTCGDEHFCNYLAHNWLVDSKCCCKFHTWWNWMLSYCQVSFQLPPRGFRFNAHIRTLNWPWQKLGTFSLVPLNCCEILGNQESFVASSRDREGNVILHRYIVTLVSVFLFFLFFFLRTTNSFYIQLYFLFYIILRYFCQFCEKDCIHKEILVFSRFLIALVIRVTFIN